MRKPFQGVVNIIRFNRHFYLLTLVLIAGGWWLLSFVAEPYYFFVKITVLLSITVTLLSLLVSFYIYDLSRLYQMKWLDEITLLPGATLVNINAGFDETSILLGAKFTETELAVFDFYNPLLHTEISIRRARKAYPPYPGTVQIDTSLIPLPADFADAVFIIFAAHEIRNENERNLFFREVARTLKPTGKIMVTEHLRDGLNFLAYNIGAFHFLSRRCWYRTFSEANLIISGEKKVNPFITNFTLTKHGSPS